MHIPMMLAAGIALLFTLCALGRSRDGDIGQTRAARAFVPLWLVATLVHLAIGVSGGSANGSTVSLPGLLIGFLVPASVAWRLGRRSVARRRRPTVAG